MPRGLGKVQQAILKYFKSLEGGGGLLDNSTENVMTEFKKQYYPEFYGPDSSYVLSTQQYKKGQNKARVTIHNAIKGLIERGYIQSKAHYTVRSGRLWYTDVYITDEGRKAISKRKLTRINK